MATLERLAPPTSALPQKAPAWSPRRAIAVSIVLAAAIALLQVLQSSSAAHTGQSMQRLEQERSSLQAQIHQMQAEVSALSSLDRIERAARDRLGMIQARNTEYVSVDVEAPSRALLPRPLIQPTVEPTAEELTWWQSLLQAVPLP